MKKVNILLSTVYTYYLFLVLYLFICSISFFRSMAPIISSAFFGLDLTGQNESTNYQIENISVILFLSLVILTILYCVSLIVNIISLSKNYKNNEVELLFGKMRRIKLGLIPFWIINFIIYICIILFCYGGPLGLLISFLNFLYRPWSIFIGNTFLIIPIFRWASYIFLCITSIFSIAYIKYLQKNNVISKKQFITHILLQLFFVTDIIDVIYMNKVWVKSKLVNKTVND